MDGIPPTAIMGGLALVAFGGWSLAAYFGRLVYVGKLVPRSAVEDVIHDRDEWRTAHRISEQARLEEREHSATLVQNVAEPVKGFLEGFRKATRNEVDDQ